VEFARSTEAVAAAERFAYWREVIWEQFLPIDARRPGDGAFAGAVAGRSLGPLTISRISSQAQRVCRTPALVERGGADAIYLNVQLRGEGSASQDGRTAHQRPGDLAAVDGTRPFELAFEADFEQLCVSFPLALLAPRLALPRAATAVRVGGDSGLGALLVNQLTLLARLGARLDREAGALVADQLIELLALALGRACEVPGTANRALLLQAAIDRIERDLGDPALSTEGVAHGVNISTRYLQRLFAEQGTSFGRWVLARRLERCHRDLADPALSHLSIGRIAERWGFVDRSHFARTFRDRYGLAPREHRASA